MSKLTLSERVAYLEADRVNRHSTLAERRLTINAATRTRVGELRGKPLPHEETGRSSWSRGFRRNKDHPRATVARASPAGTPEGFIDQDGTPPDVTVRHHRSSLL
jgi:hypothetical protein